jgi:ribonuclease VapC
MMFVDTSAIVAVLTKEHRGAEIASVLAAAQNSITSPLVRLEAAMVLATAYAITPTEAEQMFDEFVREAGVVIVPIDDAIGRMAVKACEKYGKGRHPAKLNLADCMTYAAAKSHAAPLLFIGDDFTKTDIKSALEDPRP